MPVSRIILARPRHPEWGGLLRSYITTPCLFLPPLASLLLTLTPSAQNAFLMILIHRLVAAASARPPHQVVCLHAERTRFLKRRWRGTAEDGTEFGFDLSDRLHSGCVIHQEPDLDYVIQQIPELVIEIILTTSAQAALVAWKLGNLHYPVEITAASIRVLEDATTLALVVREGWQHSSATVIFKPLRVTAHAS
jgi:urease accessory protein